MKKIICDFFDEKIDTKSEPYKDKCSPNDTYKNKKDIRENILRQFYDKHLFRKSLVCQLDETQGKSVFVILMNPSYADESGLDGTLHNVYSFINKINEKQKDNNKKYSQFEVLNIFPIRMAQSSCLPCLLERYDKDRTFCKKNIKYIKKRLEDKPEWDVIVAWGKDYHLYNEAQKICELLEHRDNIYAYNLNGKDKYHTPSHFSSQVYNNINEKKLIPISFEKFEGKFYLVEK